MTSEADPHQAHPRFNRLGKHPAKIPYNQPSPRPKLVRLLLFSRQFPSYSPCWLSISSSAWVIPPSVLKYMRKSTVAPSPSISYR